MRGTVVFAGVIIGLPAAAFAATWLLSDGAPLRSPAAGLAETAPPARHTAPPARQTSPRLGPRPDQGSVPTTAPAPTGRPPARAETAALPVRGSGGDAPLDDWGRLEARAAQGDRDALLFLTLMRMAEPLGRSGRP